MRVRKALRKTHRWIGMLAALWLLQLATTGLLLQHADDLKLTTTYVNSPWVLKWFDYGQRQQAWDDQGDVFYQVDDVLAYSGFTVKQAEKMIAVVKSQQDWLAISAQTIYRYNQQGELVMQLDSFDGIPTPIEQVAYTPDSLATELLAIQSAGKWSVLDYNGSVLPMISQPIEVIQSRALTAAEEGVLFPTMLSDRLSYDKVLHGIHSGLKSSNWLNSLSALALLYLSFSGLYLFFKQPKSKRTV